MHKILKFTKNLLKTIVYWLFIFYMIAVACLATRAFVRSCGEIEHVNVYLQEYQQEIIAPAEDTTDDIVYSI